MYPVTDGDTVYLSSIFMKIVNDGFNVKQWRDFFTSESKNLRIFIPIKRFVAKPASEWISLICTEFEKNHSQKSSNNQTVS